MSCPRDTIQQQQPPKLSIKWLTHTYTLQLYHFLKTLKFCLKKKKKNPKILSFPLSPLHPLEEAGMAPTIALIAKL
jgi:hypothetical protein